MSRLVSRANSSLWLIALFATALAVICELWRNTITLEPIQVPKNLEEAGYGPTVAAQQITDQIQAMQATATATRTALGIELKGSRPDVQILGGNLSIGSFVAYIRHALSFPGHRVSGEITHIGNRFSLTLRFAGDTHPVAVTITEDDLTDAPPSPPAPAKANASAIPALLQKGAHRILAIIDPFSAAAYYFKTGKQELSLPLLITCLKNASKEDDPWALNLWGALDQNNGQYASARAKFEQAIALNPGFWPAYHNLALTFLQAPPAPDYEKAEVFFRKAIRINRWSAVSYAELSNMLIRGQDYGKADDVIHNGVQAVLEPSPLFINWAKLYLESKNSRNDANMALQKLKTALRYAPGSGDAHSLMALAHYRLGEYTEAWHHVTIAKHLNEKLPMTYQVMELLLAESQEPNLNGAAAHFKQAIQWDGRNADNYANLGRVLARLGRDHEALNALEQAADIDPEAVKASGLLMERLTAKVRAGKPGPS